MPVEHERAQVIKSKFEAIKQGFEKPNLNLKDDEEIVKIDAKGRII